MPLVCYTPRKFSSESWEIICRANEIIEDYQLQGYRLTLRQLYYQFVARDLLPNEEKSYNKLGTLVSAARLAGEIDWAAIEDRTRNLHQTRHWDSPSDIVAEDAQIFQTDLWEDQDYRPEVWVEKEALSGVFEGICNTFRVPLFACRGYCSQSEMWGASQRFLEWRDDGQEPIILYFGDHDPSGIDMTRDVEDRLSHFMRGYQIEVRRLALNMPQIVSYSPPPNPAKLTDSRAKDYLKKYGNQSWELDALEPKILVGLVHTEIQGLLDGALWKKSIKKEEEGKRLLKEVSRNWDTLTGRL